MIFLRSVMLFEILRIRQGNVNSFQQNKGGYINIQVLTVEKVFSEIQIFQ